MAETENTTTPEVVEACRAKCEKGLVVIRRTLASLKKPSFDQALLTSSSSAQVTPSTKGSAEAPAAKAVAAEAAAVPGAPAAATEMRPPAAGEDNSQREEDAMVAGSHSSFGNSSSGDFKQVLDVLLTCGKHLDMIATKFTVTVEACASQGENNSAWAAALCKSVDASCENFVSSCLVASACGGGYFLRREVLRNGVSIVSALESQLKCAVQRLREEVSASDNSKKQLVLLTGQVTSSCNDLRRVPKSNKGYLKRMILEAYKQSLDIFKEQKEMVEESQDSPRVDDNSTSEASSAAVDDFDDDFMDYDFSLSATEIVLSRECLRIMNQSSEYLKSVARAVSSCIAKDVYTAVAVGAIDDGCQATEKFGTALNELGIVLCPPQVKENIFATVDELIASADSLRNAVEKMIANSGTSGQSNNMKSTDAIDDASPLVAIGNALSQLKELAADINH